MNIEQIFNYESLLLAWHRYVHLVPQDNDKDYFGLKVFSIDLEENLSELSKKLIERKYVPGKAIKYFKPKPSGLLRTITQFNIEDGLVFQCIANYIGYKSYEILEHNYNFVLGSVLNPEVKDWTNKK